MIRRALVIGVIGTGALVLGIVILIGAGSASGTNCGAAAGGPSSVNGIPSQDLPYFEGAASYYQLGSNGWAYLAAINENESQFGTSNLPGVHSGRNYAGAAGPMQLGIGGAAGPTWQTYESKIPANLNGGTQPPSVYNEADAVYAGAAYLKALGAPGNWAAALKGWNNYQPEITFVETKVAEWTGETTTAGTGTGTGTATAPAPANSGAGTCLAVSGPTIPGLTAQIGKNGLAEIPSGAPPAVQGMLAAGNELIDYPYSWGGGHSVASMKIPPGAKADPGEEENGGPGYDCSSATSFVLWGGGLGQSLLHGQVLTSGEFANVGDPGQGQWVTYYWGTSAGQGHVFIEVDGIVMDTVQIEPGVPAGTGPRWRPLADVQAELSSGSFQARHPPGM